MKNSSRMYFAATALSLLLIALLALRISARIEPSWNAREPLPSAYLWSARWADVIAQALILLAAIAAVAHVLRRVTGR